MGMPRPWMVGGRRGGESHCMERRSTEARGEEEEDVSGPIFMGFQTINLISTSLMYSCTLYNLAINTLHPGQ